MVRTPDADGKLLIAGLAEISADYDGILCDVWGVVHNGMTRTDGASEALAQFRKGGGSVVMITNAPRPKEQVIAKLELFNISSDSYDDIITSGDATRALISDYEGQTIHWVGPSKDKELFDGIDVKFGEARDAAVVICTDLDDSSHGEQPSDYHDRCIEWRDLGLTMICANPDKVVEVGDRLVYCGGALADYYEELGGKVEMVGKPFAPIYDIALEKLAKASGKPVDKSRVLAIGDSLRTDVKGAAQNGLPMLFISAGIHAEELGERAAPSEAKLRELLQGQDSHIAGVIPSLTW